MADGWQAVASLPPIEAGELQVWRVDLAAASEWVEANQESLSGEERERAARLRAGQVRMQFVAARACLRVLLGKVLEVHPREVPITLGSYGKPETPAVDGKPLYFNVAHSRETVLVAICRGSRVGIDLEYFDRETDIVEVARASFTAGECRQIEATGGSEQQRRSFFRCWTRKEAVVKADGRGLSLPLTSFEVPVLADARATLVRVAKPIGEFAEWHVGDLDLGEEIAGAFATEAVDLRLSPFIFPLAELHETDSKD